MGRHQLQIVHPNQLYGLWSSLILYESCPIFQREAAQVWGLNASLSSVTAHAANQWWQQLRSGRRLRHTLLNDAHRRGKNTRTTETQRQENSWTMKNMSIRSVHWGKRVSPVTVNGSRTLMWRLLRGAKQSSSLPDGHSVSYMLKTWTRHYCSVEL